MKTITLDFTDCFHYLQIWRIIKEAYDFPNYFGNNLDALWDCLDCYDDEDIHTRIIGTNALPKELHEHMGEILEVFNDVHKENPNMTFEVVS